MFALFQKSTNEIRTNRNSLTTISGGSNYSFDLDIIRETPDVDLHIIITDVEDQHQIVTLYTVESPFKPVLVRAPIIPIF